MKKFSFLLLTTLALFPLTISAKLAAPSAQQVSMELSRVAEAAMPAVVAIKVEQKATPQFDRYQFEFFDQPREFFGDDFWQRFFGNPRRSPRQEDQPIIQGQGSGFLVSSDGLILTNHHIVKNAEKIRVKLQTGREYAAEVIGTDENSDIAIIKIEADHLPFLELGNSDNLRIGEWVMAIGNPLGLQATVTVGIVSAKSRSNLGLANYEDFIQTDAAINLGNSGGPLLNLEGLVIGINTAIATRSGGYMGIGFAIPSNMPAAIMEQLIKEGNVTRSFIGVILQEIDDHLARSFQLDKVTGVLVTDVTKDSPAERAGLKQGDVILEVDGNKVEGIAPLRNRISLIKPGTEIALKLWRNGAEEKVFVAVEPQEEQLATSLETAKKIGLEVRAIEDNSEESGVVVTKVASGSLAHLAGIQPGDLVKELNRVAVTSPEKFREELKKNEENPILLITLKRQNVTRYITLVIN